MNFVSSTNSLKWLVTGILLFSLVACKFGSNKGVQAQQQTTEKANEAVEAPCGGQPKYADTRMRMLEGIRGYFDLAEAKECAKQLNKPILIRIKGFGCTNCKKMEVSTFKDQRVIDKINNEFVLVVLYYDDKTPIGADEQYIAGSTTPTVGKRTIEYQNTKFGTIGGPYFAVIDADENILEKGLGFSDADELLEFLNKGLEAAKK